MARKPKAQQQPRALSTDLAIQTYFRGSMYTELQKFKDRDRDRQLMLGETDLQELDVQAYGLDLTVSEDKALHAIQVLLDRTDYQGNIPGDLVRSEAYKYDGLIPRLSISYSEYFEAYGLDRAKDGRYHGAQAQEAILALKSLTKARRICYSRRRRIGSGKKSRLVYDVIRVTKPLISTMEGFSNLEKEEAEQVIDGQELPSKRQTRLIIEVSPLLVDQIDSFYLLKPVTLHSEIKQLFKGKRISRAVPLFIQWLLTKNSKTVKISKVRLAEKLRLDSLIEQRHQGRLNICLQKAFWAAKELEYLLDYKEEPTGLLFFTLNPVRIKRISQQVEEDLN